MKFLDRKEQVLELQMTQYGKALMSRGVFQPAYYAFFDDDVVYDSEYMSTGGDTTAISTVLEASTTTSDRIRDAIRTEPQYNYAGIETNINRLQYSYEFYLGATGITDPETGKLISVTPIGSAIITPLTTEESLALLANPPSAIDNYYSLGLPMGTSEYNTSKAPAWKLNFHNGEITNLTSENGVEFFTGSGGLLQIPQLEVEAIYDVYIKGGQPDPSLELEDVNITEFNSGYIKIEKNHILVDVGELNSIFENENFDIEVYEIETGLGYIGSDIGIQENLRPLYFMKEQQADENLFDSTTLATQQETQANVEYYFEITVDDEIQDNVGLVSSVSIYDTSPNIKEPC